MKLERIAVTAINAKLMTANNVGGAIRRRLRNPSKPKAVTNDVGSMFILCILAGPWRVLVFAFIGGNVGHGGADRYTDTGKAAK